MYNPHQVQLIGWHLPDDIDYIDLVEALNRIKTTLDYEAEELSRGIKLLEFLINEKYCQAFIVVEIAPPPSDGKLPIHEAYHCPYWDKIEERAMAFSFDVEKNLVRSGGIEGKLKIPKLGFERGLATFSNNFMLTEKSSSPARSSLTFNCRTEAIKATVEEAINRAAGQGMTLVKCDLPGTRNDLAAFLYKKYPTLFERYDQKWMNAQFKKLDIKFGRGNRLGSGTIWRELFPDDFLI